MKSLAAVVIFLLIAFCGLSQSLNMTLKANWDSNGGQDYSDCWGYNAPNGTEVAILGSYQHIYFFNVTNPINPQIIGSFSVQDTNGATNSSIWRDFKTYSHYAYACADQGTSGLVIFDLQYVPDSVVLVNQTRQFWMRSHNIWIDAAAGRLYTAGANTNGAGTIVLDLQADPENPVQIGTPTFPLGYAHDIHVVNNIAYASHGSDQALSIYNFTIATAPVLIKTLDDYPEPGYNHSAWLDASGNRLVFADETHGQALKLVNPNLAEPQTTDYHLFQSQLLTNNTNSIAHNPFIKDDLVYVAYYHDGVQVFDISDVNNIVRVAYYDTYVNANYVGYEGCWGVYPFLQSGNIIASDISNGLFVLGMTGGILALQFLEFNAFRIYDDAQLEWRSTAPEDGDRFVIEHSRDGVSFSVLTEVPAEVNTYTYQVVHDDPGPGMHFYRVVVDRADGSPNTSGVRQVQFDLEEALQLRPTVTTGLLELDTKSAGQGSIIAVDGRHLMSIEAGDLDRTRVDVGHLPTGRYYLVFSSGGVEYVRAFTKL